MKLCQLLVTFLLLWGEVCGFMKLRISEYTAAEGEDITAECMVYNSGIWKVLCKNDCDKKEDILIETTENSLQLGRYSIKHEINYPAPDIIHVSIRNVSSSDSGLYNCVSETRTEGRRTKSQSDEFLIHVTRVLTTRPSTLIPPSHNEMTTPQKLQQNLKPSEQEEKAPSDQEVNEKPRDSKTEA